MNLEYIVSQIQAAETEADGEAILREAIEKWVGADHYIDYSQRDLYGKGHLEWLETRNNFRHELLASIQPKEMK